MAEPNGLTKTLEGQTGSLHTGPEALRPEGEEQMNIEETWTTSDATKSYETSQTVSSMECEGSTKLTDSDGTDLKRKRPDDAEVEGDVKKRKLDEEPAPTPMATDGTEAGEEPDEYEVVEIINRRFYRKNWEWKVVWNVGEPTWEPKASFVDKDEEGVEVENEAWTAFEAAHPYPATKQAKPPSSRSPAAKPKKENSSVTPTRTEGVGTRSRGPVPTPPELPLEESPTAPRSEPVRTKKQEREETTQTEDSPPASPSAPLNPPASLSGLPRAPQAASGTKMTQAALAMQRQMAAGANGTPRSPGGIPSGMGISGMPPGGMPGMAAMQKMNPYPTAGARPYVPVQGFNTTNPYMQTCLVYAPISAGSVQPPNIPQPNIIPQNIPQPTIVVPSSAVSPNIPPPSPTTAPMILPTTLQQQQPVDPSFQAGTQS